jgi:hypothetical protein
MKRNTARSLDRRVTLEPRVLRLCYNSTTSFSLHLRALDGWIRAALCVFFGAPAAGCARIRRVIE